MNNILVKLRVVATFDAEEASEADMELLFDRITEMLLADEICEDPAVSGSLVGTRFDVDFVTLGGRVEDPTDEKLRLATNRALDHAKAVIDAIVDLSPEPGSEGGTPAVDWLSLEAQNIREPVLA